MENCTRQRLIVSAYKYLFLALTCFCLLSGHVVWASDGSIEQTHLFHQAQATFSRAQQLTGTERRLAMLKAASQFKRLVDDFGIENGYLFYNIGNAYYEAGEPGEAILYYKRAERLIPGFSDLRFNLNVTRQGINQLTEKSSWWSDSVRNVVFWHFMFDYSTRRLLAVSAFFSFWLLLAANVFLTSSLIRGAVMISLVFNLLFGGSFLTSVYQMRFVSSGVTTEKQVQARKGPGPSYEKLYEQPLPEGTEFRLVDHHGDWWKVKLVNGDDVWIDASKAEII